MITIDTKDLMKTVDWDGDPNILLTAEQVKEAIKEMGEIEE